MMHRQDVLKRLHQPGPIIAPSLLKCDFGNLSAELTALKTAGVSLVHWDVMDGHFVPNLSYGAPVIKALRDSSDFIFDAHLMIENPAQYLDDFLDAGCDCITIHHEAVENSSEIFQRIRSADRVAGLAINPQTPVEAITDLLPECDMVLVMSVEPGFGGQKFQPLAIEKLQQLQALVSPSTVLAVDGGIGPETISPTAAAGAKLFVVGSAIFDFDQAQYSTAIQNLTAKAQTGI